MFISDNVKFVREFDSSNGGTNSNKKIGDFLRLPVTIPDPKETLIFRCYDKKKNLLGEVRPKPGDKLLDLSF